VTNGRKQGMANSINIIVLATACAVFAGEIVLNARSAEHVSVALAERTHSVTAPNLAPPGENTTPNERAAFVSKSKDGHYWAWARIDGQAVRVLIDTGATAVALTPEDAKRIGVDVDLLVYNRDVNTALGMTHAAPVTLSHVSVEGADVAKVEALVVPQGLSASLLGMSYLGRLESFNANRQGMVLRP
jgi:aspartyl protease family protein